ncbi:hypothetical protein ScPMuIL_002377 [Solemya velum]
MKTRRVLVFWLNHILLNKAILGITSVNYQGIQLVDTEKVRGTTLWKIPVRSKIQCSIICAQMLLCSSFVNLPQTGECVGFRLGRSDIPDRDALPEDSTTITIMAMAKGRNEGGVSNLALNKIASQSTKLPYTGNDASYAVDGNLTTEYPYCAHTNDFDYAPWWQVDLQQIAQIHTVHLLNRDKCGERLANIDVYVGVTSGSMELCAHFPGPGNPSETVVLDCGKVKLGRYVKIQGGGRVCDSYATDYPLLQLCEVMVYGVYV